MADVSGKELGASVDSPVSCPALDAKTAMNQGADKSMYSDQAPDVIAVPNQPTDNITESDPVLDVDSFSLQLSTAENQLRGVTTDENKLIDVTTSENQLTDVTTADNQLTYVTAAEDQLTHVTTAEDQLTYVTIAEDQLTYVTAAEDQLTYVTTAGDQLTHVTTAEDQLTDVTTAEDQLTDVTTAEDQLTYVTTAEDQLTDLTTAEDQLTYVTAAEDQLSDVTTAHGQLTDVTTTEDQLTEEEVTDSESDTESDEDEHADFSKLPLPAWVKILSFLGHRDLLVMSVTCHTLHDICKTSSILWRSASINLMSGRLRQQVKLNPTERSVLRAHCHQMTNVVVYFKCLWNLMLEESSFRLLCDATRRWRLKCLEVGTDVMRSSYYLLINEPEVVQDFLDNCVTSPTVSELSCLKIIGNDWVTGNGKSGVVEALKHSSFTSSLTRLYLATDMPVPHESNEFCNAIGRYQNLQYLMIPYSYLSNSLLNNFSKHLKEVHFIVQTWGTAQIATNWPEVLALSPHLKVGLIFAGYFTFDFLPDVLSSDVPVSFVMIQNMCAECGFAQLDLLQLLPQYFGNLSVLHCVYRASTNDLEEMLFHAVHNCPKLYHLHFYSHITSHAVVTLARMRQWAVLEIDPEFISFSDSGNRDEQLRSLFVEVSGLLGRDWKPQSRNASLSAARPSLMKLPLIPTCPPIRHLIL